MKVGLVVVVMFAACGGDDGASVDAPVAVDARTHAGTAKSHTLFVNTEGLAVIKGPDDATTDHSSLPTADKTLRGFALTDSQRQTAIDGIVGELTRILTPYDITIVTTRPGAGPYDMLVITDDNSSQLITSAGVGSLTPTSCNTIASVIAFQFGGATRNDIVRNAIAMFGLQNGIPVSKTANDCMCLVDAVCNTLTQPCTIGGAGTLIDPQANCGDSATAMDEASKFSLAFGPH